MSVCAPVLAALGAVLSATRRRPTTNWSLRAANWSARAAAATAAGVIAVVWSSQKIARDTDGTGATALYVAVVAGTWLLASAFMGAALGSGYRSARTTLARVGFAEAAGGAVGALLVPLALAYGSPRGGLGLALVLGIAGLLFAAAARSARTPWPVLVTVPLALSALLAGDIGDSWLDLRVDLAKRTSIATRLWTPRAVVAVKRPSRGSAALLIDGEEPIPLAEKKKGKRKPSFKPQDLPFIVDKKSDGKALVIASGGLREVRVALAYGHLQVDVVEREPSVLSELLLDSYAALTGHLLASPGVELKVGDPRAVLRGLPNDYQHIVVMAREAYADPPTRMLSEVDRFRTRQALREYLTHVTDDGSVAVASSSQQLPSLIAAAREVLGGTDTIKADEHLFACAGTGEAALLMSRRPLAKRNHHTLRKACNKRRFTLQFPVEAPRKGNRHYDKKLVEAQRAEALLTGGHVIDDDRPFAEPPIGQASLAAASVAAFKALELDRKSLRRDALAARERAELRDPKGATKKKSAKKKSAKKAASPSPGKPDLLKALM